jgi:hypothetical protein
MAKHSHKEGAEGDSGQEVRPSQEPGVLSEFRLQEPFEHGSGQEAPRDWV